MIEVIVTAIKPSRDAKAEPMVFVTKVIFHTDDDHYEAWLADARHYLATVETLTEA